MLYVAYDQVLRHAKCAYTQLTFMVPTFALSPSFDTNKSLKKEDFFQRNKGNCMSALVDKIKSKNLLLHTLTILR